jgi:transcription elongation GreA/GreB family factor
MSVAFRRESDEEHLEPKFELPIPPGPNLVTARGLALIGDRIAELESQLQGTADESEIAALKRDLRYWQTRQITAQIAPISSGDAVEFGVQVSILLNGAPKTFQLVGDDEANPEAGLISFNAPLSRAILRAGVGEVLPFGDVPDAIEILEIQLPQTAKCNNP